uniref:THAP domain-containing protein 1 n=1 Tax=Electrophorus electricus TaxID=8005 RepID=A0A4W4GZP0_ELEEL
MVFYCCAYNCKNNTKDKSLAFHSFPRKDTELRKKWLKNMRWKNWTPAPHSRICSSHFEKKCYSLIDGPRRRLHSWAVPTIFSFPAHLQNRKVKASIQSLPPRRSPHCIPAPARRSTAQGSEESNPHSNPEFSVEKEMALPQLAACQSLVKPDKRSVHLQTKDESLERSMTIPSFFHSAYCFFHWDGDAELNIMPRTVYGVSGQTKPNIIEVKERWEWLGLDVRGPFPMTADGHIHIMTLTDYYSKWVEAFPLTNSMIQNAATCLAEVILQLGYPLAVLSRLSKRLLLDINRDLKKHLNINTSSLIIHHRQTGYLDLVTESLLSKMASELVTEYPDTWHIHLPAASLRLCCTEHPTTRRRPFAVMFSTSPAVFSSPREYIVSDICLSSFVIVSSEGSKGNNTQTNPSPYSKRITAALNTTFTS